MRVESQTYALRSFRPRTHEALPDGWTKSSLLTLVFGIAHQIGLNATDLMVLRRIAQKTRAPDYQDPERSPICFERQIDMAASIGLSTEQWRRVERKLERLRLIARATAANGHRGRVSGSRGLESCAGLSLEPLIARLEELLEIEARQIEASERLALFRLEISKARREIRRLEDSLGDRSPATMLAEARAIWLSPRSYTTPMRAEAHLTILEVLVEKLREMVRLSSDMTGASVADDRCHKHNTTETLLKSCSAPNGAKSDEEKKGEAFDAGINAEFMSQLTIARLRDLASTDLRSYIDDAPGKSGSPSLSDIDWAVLRYIRDLGINPSAFEEAMETMGWLRAMLSVIVIDRNRTHPIRPILNPGGALRAFTKRYLRGELDLRASIFGIWGREGRMH